MSASRQEIYDKPRQHAESKDITLPTKVPVVKATIFPVVTYDCESRTIKKVEHQRTDAFELWYWRRLHKEIKPVHLKGNQPEISQSEGLVLKLKLRYTGHLMQTADSLEKSLMLGKTEGRSRRRHQRMRWLDGITDAMDMTLSNLGRRREGQRGLACCSPWGRKESGTTGRLNNNSNFVVIM